MKRRRERKALIFAPVASMGDIAFLLIIFFVLTSNFVKEAHLELEEPSAPELEELEESTISIKIDAEGTVHLQGEPVDVGSLEAEVNDLLRTRPDAMVMITVDRELPQEKYGPVIMAVGGTGAKIALIGKKHENEE